MRKRFLALVVMVLVGSALWVGSASAGSPHFIKSATNATVSGNTVTATFKEAGLGDEPQVHVVLSGDAQCVNPGGNDPQAGNKQSFNAAGDFPVQNGQTEGTLTLTATFKPSCAPPMKVRWDNLVLTDTTSGISVAL